MKICERHWAALRAAIEARGLWSLVGNKEMLAERITQEIDGSAEAQTYDPMYAATMMIYGRAVELGGLYLMTGDYCPVCEAVKHRAGVPDAKLGRPYTTEEEESYWIDGPCDSALAYCREHNLVPSVQ